MQKIHHLFCVQHFAKALCQAKFNDDRSCIKPNVRARIPNSFYEMGLQGIKVVSFHQLGVPVLEYWERNFKVSVPDRKEGEYELACRVGEASGLFS